VWYNWGRSKFDAFCRERRVIAMNGEGGKIKIFEDKKGVDNPRSDGYLW